MTKFNDDLKRGKVGEELLLKLWPTTLTPLPGTGADFLEETTGRLVELKTDYYDVRKTGNFFIERFSNLSKKSPGSVWQAELNKCSLFVYMFINSKRYYVFNVSDLLAYFEHNITKYAKIEVPNGSYKSLGMKVPVSHLADFATRVDFNE